MKFIGILGIMVLAAVRGYLTARFVPASFLGYDSDVLKPAFAAKFDEILGKDNKSPVPKVKETGDYGYGLRFGSFSTEERGRKFAPVLGEEGLEVSVGAKDGRYKVRGKLSTSRQEASKALKELENDAVSNVFVTVIP